MCATWDKQRLAHLIEQLGEIRAAMLELERQFADDLARSNPSYRRSADNFLHYLALRQRDIRSLQDELANLGLSSLGRSEGHVMATVDALLMILSRLADTPWQPRSGPVRYVDFPEGAELLEGHTQTLLGRPPEHRQVRIMVTMPADSADNYPLVRGLLESGMDCARINCAHDDPETWEKIVENLKRARHELGKECPILMDLGGPKLRTGPIEEGPRVIKWRPLRNQLGQVVRPALIWMTSEPNQFRSMADARLPVMPREWLSNLQIGDRVSFTDARGASRRLEISAVEDYGCWAECERTAYVSPGTSLIFERRGEPPAVAEVGDLPPLENAILLRKGDRLILTRDDRPGHAAEHDDEGREIGPATISCTLAEVFPMVRAKERIWFDDGRIGGIVRSVTAEQIEVEITNARATGDRLLAEKGINLPDTNLELSALTAKDCDDLRFVAAYADLVGLSFVRHENDVDDLLAHLHELNGERLGVILKIETAQAFARLPNLILAVMRHHTAAVMIARGDLAVECGYERLAEIQEEILWLCEAAHMPVIWATQVLESLAKKGQPSRAEITDAAMSERAECVMLNKGPHILGAVRALDDILCRMQAHQRKKMSRLRILHLKPRHPATARTKSNGVPNAAADPAKILNP
jgi:pyruvate kinase